MKIYSSPKWTLFATRPISILNRDIRKYWYINIDKINPKLKLSRLFIIGSSVNNAVYVDKIEDQKAQVIVQNDLNSKNSHNIIEKYQKIPNIYGNNPLDQLINICSNYLPVLIYTHYLERILTKKDSKLSSRNEMLRDKLIKYYNGLFDKTFDYLKLISLNKISEYQTLNEINNIKENNIKNINARKKFYAGIINSKTSGIHTGKIAVEILKKEGFSIEHKSTNNISGHGVSKGKVIGQIIVIRNIDDFKIKDYQNKIIVSPMTTVEFQPYLKYAKALVANEGGVNCHAAVIAREYNIPCIVNTKYATDIFKDGDLVEVDATTGVVKKLSSL